MRVATVVLLGLVLALGAHAAEGNLAKNGGFEDGMEGWKVNNPGGTLTADVDRKERKEGRAAGHVVKTGGFAGDWLYLPVDGLPGGERVTVSAFVRGKDLGNTWLKFVVFDGAGQSIVEDCDLRQLRSTFDWQKVERSFSLPKEAVRGELRLCMFMAGEAWIDEVRVGSAAVKPRKALDRRLTAWLDDHAVVVDGLDFTASYDDLAPLEKVLEGVRVVQLGESSHGDGATQRAKARLVRFLHERLGFTVLAFESGMYECERANELLAEGRPREAMKAGVFKIWCLKETEPLFAWMAETAKSERPLRLSGFDPQQSGDWADKLLDDVFARVDVDEKDRETLRSLQARLREDEYAPDAKTREAGRAALARVADVLAAAEADRETALLERCVENLQIFEQLRALGDGGARWEGFNLRDGRMGENLRWLAEVRYPGEKIVTWAATVHQAHELRTVTVGGNASFYKGCRAAGEVVDEAFGKACYTIGFCAHDGVAGRFRPEGDLDEPQEGSLEDVLFRYGKPFLLLDLRAGGPLDKKLLCGLMGHDRRMSARWSKVLDGVFYCEEMSSTSWMGDD